MVFNALFTWGLSNKLGIPLTLNSSNIAVCLLLVPSPQLITSASTESGIRVKIRKIKVLDYFVLDDLVFFVSFLLSFKHSSVCSEPDITSTLSRVWFELQMLSRYDALHNRLSNSSTGSKSQHGRWGKFNLLNLTLSTRFAENSLTINLPLKLMQQAWNQTFKCSMTALGSRSNDASAVNWEL